MDVQAPGNRAGCFSGDVAAELLTAIQVDGKDRV